ncbi:SusC/RagA family TonB-linked outer membrane protein, partial [Dysgonomonas sp. OttesenSCG-928-D17]|nr:SusC/RagA family TonB-linked outer membrane protein [Dysgonomonas sp. OttesenSCG-928-D17]
MKNRINHLLNFFILHFPARKTLLLVCMLSVPFLAIANQSFTVTGTVTDEDNEPLIGVNITVEGTSGSSIKGTATDLKGEYRLEGISRDAVLIFSYVGYAEQRIAVGGQSVINVTLRSNSKELDEVVVVGYGSVKKKDLTGAVSIVDTDVLKNKSVTTLADALQGAATGVYVRGGSQPGSESAIQIRGVSSLTNNNPLYVIDGMLTSANRDLNVADIESIQILKDASAAAIYGSRAANGVIIITTKKGTEGPMKVSASLRKGIQTTPRYDLADRNEFIRLNDMAYANAGLPAQDHRPDINTDWQDAAFRTGQVDDYNVSLSGGGKFSNYMVSGNYFKNKGTLIGTSFDRVSVRVNTEARKGILKFGENLAISNATSTELPTLNPYWEVLRMLPTIPVYDEENPGGYGYGDGSRAKTFGSNPVAMTDLQNRSNENFRLRGNAFLEVDLFKIFTYKVNFGYETSFSNHRYLRKEGTWTYNQPANDPSEIYEIRAQYENILVENTLNFNFDIGKHHLDGVGGITYQKEQNRQIGAQKKTILRTSSGEYFREIDAGSSDPQSYGNGWNTVMISYLGRVNYNYDGKYLLTGTIRSDGSSRFKEGKRWGVFPSVSGAWRISSENFFSVDWVDDLKIRANYGTLGSVNIGAYDYFAVINQNTPAIFNNQIFPGSTQVKLINENLKWETLVQQNYGIDAVLFNNRLSVGMEYYIADSKDILYGMPIASSTGNDGGNPVVNAASLKNTGFELSLLWRDKIGKVNYKVGLNTTTLKNKVKGLGYGEEEVITETTISKVGKPLGMWYLI